VPCLIGTVPTLCTNVPGNETVGAIKFISVPVGAVVSGTILTITGPLSQPPCPLTPIGQVFLDHCFQVTWTGPDGKPLTVLAKAVHDCLAFDSGDLAQAGGNPANLFIGFVFDPTTNTWTLVKTTVDGNKVCADPDQIFYFQALFAPVPQLPTTGASPSGMLWSVLIGLGVFCLGIGWRVAHTRTRS
jgi:hypothetical protein